jgi:hypothetical protein
MEVGVGGFVKSRPSAKLHYTDLQSISLPPPQSLPSLIRAPSSTAFSITRMPVASASMGHELAMYRSIYIHKIILKNMPQKCIYNTIIQKNISDI